MWVDAPGGSATPSESSCFAAILQTFNSNEQSRSSACLAFGCQPLSNGHLPIVYVEEVVHSRISF